MQGWCVMPGISRVTIRLGRRLAYLLLRLARISAIAASVAGILIVLDAILLPDDDPERPGP